MNDCEINDLAINDCVIMTVLQWLCNDDCVMMTVL